MSPLAIVVIVLLALLVVLFIGGWIAAHRRAQANADDLTQRIAAADRALEAARAADRGWDPVLLEEAARAALQREQPNFRYDRLSLVLVDDRPGTEEDRAEFVAAADTELVRIAVVRQGERWVAELLG